MENLGSGGTPYRHFYPPDALAGKAHAGALTACGPET
jgi:hypothetical protein